MRQPPTGTVQYFYLCAHELEEPRGDPPGLCDVLHLVTDNLELIHEIPLRLRTHVAKFATWGGVSDAGAHQSRILRPQSPDASAVVVGRHCVCPGASGILNTVKQRVYVETSVISYLTSRPARDLVVAAHQELTREWWEQRSGSFELVISELVEQEAGAGDPRAA